MTTAILDIRPAHRLSSASPERATSDLVRQFALDCAPGDRRIVCRWRRDADSRLTCSWEPDIVPVPQL